MAWQCGTKADRRPSGWRVLGMVLALLAGCRAPAAHFSAANTGSSLPLCSLLFARQIVADSAVEMTYHPVRGSLGLVAEPANHLWSAGRGAFGKRVVMPLSPNPPPHEPGRPSMIADALEQTLDHELGSRLEPALVELYPEGEKALQAVVRLIDTATQRIDVLMFQWENDSLGAELADRIAARADANIRVRVLVDGGGNLIFGIPGHQHSRDVNAVMARLARNPNIELVRTRNPFGRVDHRKLVLVDGRAAWTGGRNFTRPSFYTQRDVSFTIEGALAARLQDEFDEFWDEQGGALSPVEKARIRSRGQAPRPVGTPIPNARARLVCTRPMDHQIETTLYRAVDCAEHHVYMENYTFCDSLLVYKLAQARQRGADVRVVLSFSDGTRAINRANRVVANRLQRAGVRVYVYPGLPHTKAAAVDGCWAYLGSGNFDPLSLRRNLEMGITVSDCPLVEEIERTVFQPDLREDWELTKPLPLGPCDYFCELFAGLCL